MCVVLCSTCFCFILKEYASFQPNYLTFNTCTAALTLISTVLVAMIHTFFFDMQLQSCMAEYSFVRVNLLYIFRLISLFWVYLSAMLNLFIIYKN